METNTPKILLFTFLGFILMGCIPISSKTQQIVPTTQSSEKSSTTATILFTPAITSSSIAAITPSANNETLSTDPVISLSEHRKNQLLYRPYFQITPSSLPGWSQVTSLEYGFSFSYPSSLKLETSGNFVWIKWENQDLRIGFRRPDENISLSWAGYADVGQTGEENLGKQSLKFMGEDIPTSTLIYNNKNWIVLFNHGKDFEIKKMADGNQVGRLVMNVMLESNANPNSAPKDYQGIPAEIQNLANRILNEFQFLSHKFSGWNLYTDKDLGITFEFPKEWGVQTTLSSDPKTIPGFGIWKQEQFTGPGGEILLDVFNNQDLNLKDWLDTWHQTTGTQREKYEPSQPNAAMFSKPAILFIQPGTQAYDMLILIFNDGKAIYRLQYSMENRQVGLEVFYRMVNSMKSNLLGPSKPDLPVFDIE